MKNSALLGLGSKRHAFDLALKGRSFKPRRKCHEINFGFSR